MAVVGVFAFNFTVTLPLLAKFTFHGGAGLASVFMAAMGVGAVVGGLYTAFRSRPSTRLLACIGLVFGASILAVAVSPTALVATAMLVVMGAGAISFVATNNATLQLRSDPALRGRVMSLNAIAFLGSTPIGAPLLGAVSDAWSPRVAFVMGGVATLLATVPLFALEPPPKSPIGGRGTARSARREPTPGPTNRNPGVPSVRRDGVIGSGRPRS